MHLHEAMWNPIAFSPSHTKPNLQNEHICDLAPQNELKVAKYSLLVIPTKFQLTYSLKDAGFV